MIKGKEELAVKLSSAGYVLVTYIIAFSLEHIEHQGDAILNGCHQLPHTVFIGWVFFGPPRGGEGPVQLGDEATTGSC